MGWYGKYVYGQGRNGSITMSQVRQAIEEDTGLTVKQVKFGYAICVADDTVIEKGKLDKDYKNFICIALWNYSKKHNEIMIKQIDETFGPYHYDVPLKYVSAICKKTENNRFANTWRAEVIEAHKREKEKREMVKILKIGEEVKIYGKTYKVTGRFNKNKLPVSYCGREFIANFRQLFT